MSNTTNSTKSTKDNNLQSHSKVDTLIDNLNSYSEYGGFNASIDLFIENFSKSLARNIKLYKNDYVIDAGILLDYTGQDSKIVIPEGVHTIGNDAFYQNAGIKEVETPTSLAVIDNGAFCQTQISKVTLNEGLKSIKGNAFSWSIIESIIIPNSVTELGPGAFDQCWNLKQVSLPAQINEISGYLFWYCKNLTNIKIPDSVTKIKQFAFYGCSKLNNIELPASVTEIESKAFAECANLKSINIPDNAIVAKDAFENCPVNKTISTD